MQGDKKKKKKRVIVEKLEVEQDLATFLTVLQQGAASIGSLGLFFASKLKNIYILLSKSKQRLRSLFKKNTALEIPFK